MLPATIRLTASRARSLLSPHYDPSALREQDEIVDPGWLQRTDRVLRVGGIPGGRTTS
jgi:hypothetical protein